MSGDEKTEIKFHWPNRHAYLVTMPKVIVMHVPSFNLIPYTQKFSWYEIFAVFTNDQLTAKI